MIEYLKGFPTVIMPAKLILQVGGVGYGVETTTQVLADLASQPDQETGLWIHSYIKEDAFKLFGFKTYNERRMFEILIGISGVGPKVGLAVLSTLSTDLIADATQKEEAKVFQQVPGVGARLAKKLVVELKPKLQKEAEFAVLKAGAQKAEVEATSESGDGPAARMTGLISALENMGYPAKDVREVVGGLDLSSGASLEELLRQAFQAIGRQNSQTKRFDPQKKVDRTDESTLPF